jgi:tRNA threonylcarbamoyl adenosine modification protein (Sua5/YciO/YrdC/YwlC family)
VKTKVIQVDPNEKNAAAARRAAKVLRAGGLVAFPTETVYGIAAVATHDDAMERLRELKDRPKRPFSIHLAAPEDAARYVRDIPEEARRLMAKAWPGPVTLILPVGGKLADGSLGRRELYEQLCHDDMIGLRCPEPQVARAMLAAAAAPVVAPSANLAGQPSPRTADEVLAALDGRVDLLIDAGPTRYGKDSTIVRFGPKGHEIVRKGVCDARAIRRFLRRAYLFVCTGNTCRSPIAEGVARHMLARKLGCKDKHLAGKGVEVVSAGLHAASGGRVSPEAVEAAAKLGADIASHRTRRLTTELIRRADVVFCMTGQQAAEVRRMVGDSGADVLRLDLAEDITDPVGLDDRAYARTARRIQQALAKLFEKDLP